MNIMFIFMLKSTEHNPKIKMCEFKRDRIFFYLYEKFETKTFQFLDVLKWSTICYV